MQRREFISLIGALGMYPVAAHAQQPARRAADRSPHEL